MKNTHTWSSHNESVVDSSTDLANCELADSGTLSFRYVVMNTWSDFHETVLMMS